MMCSCFRLDRYARTCSNRPSSISTISARRFCITTRNCSSNTAEWKSALKVSRRSWARSSPKGCPALQRGACARLLSALEAAANCDVPPRAQWLRVLLAELERVYNHLHYLGHLCHTTTLKVGEAEGKYLEELAKQINCQAIGHRLLRGLVSPGGLRREPQLNGLADVLKRLRGEFTHYAAMLEASTTHLDRLITTGMLSRKLAFDQGATGPVERASGLDRDLRRDQPYAAYLSCR